VKVIFNKELLQPIVLERNQKLASWNSIDPLDLVVVGHRPINDCVLEIVIFDLPDVKDLSNKKGKFLGYFELRGSDLEEFLYPPNEGSPTPRSKKKREGKFPLVDNKAFATQSEDDFMVTVQGTVSLKVVLPKEEIASNENTFVNELEIATAADDQFQYSDIHHLRRPLNSYLQQIIPNTINVFIRSVKGLHKNDTNRYEKSYKANIIVTTIIKM